MTRIMYRMEEMIIAVLTAIAIDATMTADRLLFRGNVYCRPLERTASTIETEPNIYGQRHREYKYGRKHGDQSQAQGSPGELFSGRLIHIGDLL